MGKWELVSVSEVTNILDNKRVPITASERRSGKYPYYGANGVQDYIDNFIFDDELVLLAEDGGNFGSATRPIAYRVSGKCWVNNHAHVLKPKENLDVDYLCYSIMFYDVLPLISGTTRAKLNKSALSKMLIPLPPLDIQKRIAAALDTANALIEKRKEQIEKLDLLIKSQFIEMFGDPVTNPKGWESLLWKCVFNTTTGKLDSNAMVTYGQYPFFTCAKESFLIDVYAFDCEALILAGNNAAGIYDVKYYSGKFNAYQRTYILTLKNAHNKYCIFKMQLELRLKQLRYNSKGTNTKYLTMEILNKLDFIIPPTDLQNQFAEFVQKVEAQKALLQKSLADMEQNYQSLLQKCFKGEIF